MERGRQIVAGCMQWTEVEEESGEGLSIWSIGWLLDGRCWWYCLSCSHSYNCTRFWSVSLSCRVSRVDVPIQPDESCFFLISFVFLTMASQNRCLVFFFYINETHTILCGLFKNIKKNSYNKKKEKTVSSTK